MAFLTDIQTLEAISDALSQSGVNNVPIQMNGINKRAHAWAEQQVVAALAGRGYTTAQIAAFDQGANFVYDLTVWRALAMSRALQSLGTTGTMLLSQFDRRAELATVVYTAGGVYQDPLGTVGLPSVGDNDTSNDIFVLPPSGSTDWPGPGPSRGDLTEF